MSGRHPPPRPRPRAVPASPFPPASDLPIDVERTSGDLPLAEPIPLVSEHVPTMQSLSEQIGAVGSHLQVVHEEAALARVAAEGAAEQAHGALVAAQAARSEIADVRRLVIGDHAPRLTQVEAKTSRITLPKGAKAIGVGGGVGGIVVFAAEVLWPLVQRWIETR